MGRLDAFSDFELETLLRGLRDSVMCDGGAFEDPENFTFEADALAFELADEAARRGIEEPVPAYDLAQVLKWAFETQGRGSGTPVALSRAMVEKLQAAKADRENAQVALEDAVIVAWKAGGGIREIGDAVGMTHTGVAKLLERRGIRDRLRYEDMDRARREARGER